MFVEAFLHAKVVLRFNHLCTKFRLNLREVSDMNKLPD